MENDFLSCTSDLSIISELSDLSDFDDDCENELPPVPEVNQPLPLTDQLAVWHLECKHAREHGDSLLKILHPYHPKLPLSTAALLRTPRRTPNKIKMEPGLYYHRGLECGIRHSLSPYELDDVTEKLEIYLVDGVSLTKSSTSQFWPIVGYIPALTESPPFEVGIYWGLSKPASSNIFLRRSIEEAVNLSTNGMTWKGRKMLVFVKAFIAGAPAIASLTCTKSHASPLRGC